MDGAQAVFFLTMIMAAFFASILMVSSDKNFAKFAIPFLVLYLALSAAYVIFSFAPPELGLFYDSSARVFGPMN